MAEIPLKIFLYPVQEKGKLFYADVCLSALNFSLLPPVKTQDDSYCRSLGASGAVSAVIFCFLIILNPWPISA